MTLATSLIEIGPESSFFTRFTVVADDGHTYVCRGPEVPDHFERSLHWTLRGVFTGRTLAAQYVFAQLAQLIGPAVPAPAVITVSAPFIVANPSLGFLGAGPATCLGLLSPGATRDMHYLLDPIPSPDNRARLAVLAVMHCWFGTSDGWAISQMMASPFTDHALVIRAFPDFDLWSAEGLVLAANERAPKIGAPFAGISPVLSSAELSSPLIAMKSVTSGDIAAVTAAVPPPWWGDSDDSLEIGSYLIHRKATVLSYDPLGDSTVETDMPTRGAYLEWSAACAVARAAP